MFYVWTGRISLGVGEFDKGERLGKWEGHVVSFPLTIWN